MKFVIQRVACASVSIEGETVGEIGKGFMVLVGISDEDTKETADRMVLKMKKLRIFEDENGKTNLDLATVGGELLVISQFTLYADARKGNRSSFVRAGKPETAEPLYAYILQKCAEGGTRVEHGVFGAEMKVSLVNDGPFTIVLDSEEL